MISNNPTKRDLSDAILYVKKVWRWIITQTLYRVLFRSLGARCIIYKPIMIGGAGRIQLGRHVLIRDGARLECVSLNGAQASITIGDGVSVEQNLHLVSCGQVRIGDYVTIAPNVNLVGSSHAFDDAPSKISRVKKFGKELQYIDIGDYSFIGIGSTILSGCRIGRHVIIGAHSLVNCDIPDFSIAAGSPARVIKIFDHHLNCWRRPDASA